MIHITEKLIEHLVKQYQCPRVAKDASEQTLQNVYGKKTAKLLASGEMSPKDYVNLASPTEFDDVQIEMKRAGILFER